MNERKGQGDESPQRRPAEGVRIIRAEEAQAALETGQAAGRRPDDQLRFGDVPPSPAGPRSPHRFPLPDSVDPAAAVLLPPLAASARVAEQKVEDRRIETAQPDEWESPERAGEDSSSVMADELLATESISRVTVSEPAWEAQAADWEIGDRTAELGIPAPVGGPALPGEASATGGALAAAQARPDGGSAPNRVPEASSERPQPAPPEEGITVTGGAPELPHWTDPPTGEVPRILTDEPVGAEAPEDDLEAWNALGARGIRWRDDGDDWDEVEEFADLASVEPVGALDQTRTEHSDLYSFDEEFQRVEAARTGSGPVLIDFAEDDGDFEDFAPEPHRTTPGAPKPHRHTRSGAHRTGSRQSNRGAPTGRGSEDDLGSRVVIGLGFLILLVIAYAVGSKALLVLAALVAAAAAAELYGMLQRSGFRPATLLGLVTTVGLMFAAYWKGVEAIPLAVVLLFAGAMLWYLLRIVEARPLANVAVTTMAFVWVGVLASFAALLLRAHHGKGLFLGAVIVAVAADIAAFAVGRWIGSRPIAASISPSKTVEGFIAGLVVALVAGAIVGKEVSPWGGAKHGLLLGLIVGLVAPAGDLFESMIKRDLGVKDSGSTLLAHGGVLDRFDSLLLVLPAAYYLASLLSILK